MGDVRVRTEEPRDRAEVFAVHAAAFESDAEARLVDVLRERARPVVSLVAVDDETVVGHVLFTPMRHPARPELSLFGLAPLAVAPGRQGGGVGGALVRAGLEACRALGARAVCVLGHPSYYPRFGFVPASRWGVRSVYDVPDDTFQALELVPGALRDAAGTVEYHEAFAAL